MKILAAAFLLFAGLSAQAVQVSECPKNLKWEISQFSFNPLYDPARVPGLGASDCLYDCENDEAVVQVQLSLKAAQSVSASLHLVRAVDAICQYEGMSQLDQPVNASIRGSFRKNAKERAYLVVFTGGGAFFTNLQAMSPTQIVPAKKEASIYVVGENCSYGECALSYLKVGSAQKLSLSTNE